MRSYVSESLHRRQAYEKEDAKISVFDHGLLYGDGVFEGIRSYGGKVFRLQAHLDRLWNSAKAIWLTIPWARRKWPRPSSRPWPPTASRTATSAWSSPAAAAPWDSIPTAVPIPR